jgi:hypothetical protein
MVGNLLVYGDDQKLRPMWSQEVARILFKYNVRDRTLAVSLTYRNNSSPGCFRSGNQVDFQSKYGRDDKMLMTLGPRPENALCEILLLISALYGLSESHRVYTMLDRLIFCWGCFVPIDTYNMDGTLDTAKMRELDLPFKLPEKRFF